jgi:hypothetical protein
MLVSAYIRSIRDPRSLTPHQAGSLVVSWVSSPITTWLTLLFLLGTHLLLNYSAVRSVGMRSLNRQRANIVFAHLLAFDTLLSPQDVAKKERIFERNGVFRSHDGTVIGYGRIGVSLDTLLTQSGLGSRQKRTKSLHLGALEVVSTLLGIFQEELFVLWYAEHTSTAYIALKQGATVRTQLKAWLHGFLIARERAERRIDEKSASRDVFQNLQDTLCSTTKLFEEYEHRLTAAGWDLDIAALETHSGTRLKVQQSDLGRDSLIQQ